MDPSTALREFLEYIIGQLIDQPEEGAIAHELVDDGKRHVFRVTLTESDVGIIIGKNGHTVSAIRNLMSVAAAREGQTVTLDVVALEGRDATPEDDSAESAAEKDDE